MSLGAGRVDVKRAAGRFPDAQDDLETGGWQDTLNGHRPVLGSPRGTGRSRRSLS